MGLKIHSLFLALLSIWDLGWEIITILILTGGKRAYWTYFMLLDITVNLKDIQESLLTIILAGCWIEYFVPKVGAVSCMILLRGADRIKVLTFGANIIYLRLRESISSLHMFDYEFFGPGFDASLCSTDNSLHLFLLGYDSTFLFRYLAPLQLFILDIWRRHLFSLEKELLSLIPINKPILIWNERLPFVYYSFRFSMRLFF